MQRLYKQYKEKIAPKLKEELKVKNVFSVPRLQKIVINVGLGKILNDKEMMETVEKNIMAITGQKPIKTKAKKSISNFKIRKGLIIGMKVTLRGEKMYDFLDKLINITFPRIRDFRGIDPKAADGNGNITIGIKEYIFFPEIKLEEVEKTHGLEITIATNSRDNASCIALLKAFGFPFIK